MFPTLQLGPLALPVGPLLLLFGVWLGLWLVEREADRLRLNRDTLSALALIGLTTGVVGARLAFAAQHLSAYTADPFSLLSNNLTSFSVPAGWLIGSSAALVYGRREHLPIRRTLDALAPLLLALSGAVALAQLANGDGFGTPAQLPWSLYLWGEARHPTQVYALFASILVAGAWWRWGRAHFDGFAFLFCLAGLAMAALIIESFRGDSVLLAGGWRSTQVFALLVLGSCLAVMRLWVVAPAPDQS